MQKEKPHPLISFVVPGNPLPKERPRFGGGKAYTPQRTKVHEERIAWAARQAMLEAGLTEPLEGDLFIYVQFRRKNKRRVDLDNLDKALDGCNGVLWVDDSQIKGCLSWLVVDPGSPLTYVAVWREEDAWQIFME